MASVWTRFWLRRWQNYTFPFLTTVISGVSFAWHWLHCTSLPPFIESWSQTLIFQSKLLERNIAEKMSNGTHLPTRFNISLRNPIGARTVWTSLRKSITRMLRNEYSSSPIYLNFLSHSSWRDGIICHFRRVKFFWRQRACLWHSARRLQRS